MEVNGARNRCRYIHLSKIVISIMFTIPIMTLNEMELEISTFNSQP